MMLAAPKSLREQRREGSKEFEFHSCDFDRIRALIYREAGISLAAGKHEMVYSRLSRRLRVLNIPSFEQYLDTLERDRDNPEWQAFTNALTTNLTAFFREDHHFPILAEHVKGKKEVSVWCSAASTGEEPYSIAMTLCEAFGTLTPPVKILATDIDTNVLATAEAGVYPVERISKMSQERLSKFFQRGTGPQAGQVRVRAELRRLISFEKLNLLDQNYQINQQFDALFCRNVMIYFDKPTQGKILTRFAPLMKKDGLLFAGHSENFMYVSNLFKLRAKTVYQLT